MAWPLSQDYNEAIQNPASSFTDKELRGGLPVVNALGVPLPRSGNFADVYEYEGASGTRWAVKCFTREVAGLQGRYGEISKFLSRARLPFTVDFRYLEQGIRIRGQWYPVLKMQWVAGFLLNEFVRNNLDKPHVINKLILIWQRMGRRLHDAAIAHADLQHGNVILVPGKKPGALAVKLIDYDGMFVPALANRKSGEVGHPSYQHPQRLQQGIYSAAVDRLPLLAIDCGLRCLTVGGRALWERHDNGDNLLFREADLRRPGESALLRELWNLRDAAAHDLVGHLSLGLTGSLERVPLLHELTNGKEVRPLTAAQEAQVTSLLGPGASVTRAAVTAAPPPAQPGRPAPDPWESLEDEDEYEPIVPRSRRSVARASMLPWALGAAVLGIAMVSGLAFLFIGKKGNHDQHKTDLVHTSPTRKDAVHSDNDPVEPKPPQKKDRPKKQPEAVAEAFEKGSINLLALLGPKRLPENVTKGNWVRDEGAVVCDPSRPSLLKLPYELPAEYRLRVRLERLQGEDAVAIPLMASGNRFAVVFDGGKGEKSGLELVDGKLVWMAGNPTSISGHFFEVNKPHDLVCEVRQGSITVSLDGKETIRFLGDAKRLSSGWEVPDQTYAYLGSWGSSFKFSRVVLTPLEPPTQVASASWSHVRTTMAENKNGIMQIEPKGSVCTTQEYAGPLEINVEARSASKRITISAHRTHYVLALPDADSWHKLRFIITDKSVKHWIDNKPNKTVRDQDLGTPAGVFVRAADGVVQLKVLEVKPVNVPVIAAKPPPEKSAGRPITFVVNRAPDQPIDLLGRIDTTKQAGAWELTGKTLASDQRAFSRLDIPFGPVPEEYQMTVEATREKGTDALCLGLISPSGAQFMVVLDSRQKSGMELVDGKTAADKLNPIRYAGPLFKPFEPATIVCTVQKKAILVKVDDQKILSCPGSYKGFTLLRSWATGSKGSLFLGTQKTTYRITELKLLPLSKQPLNVTVHLALPDKNSLPAPKWPRPGADEVAAADKELRVAFAKQFAGTTEKDKQNLFQLLWNEALSTNRPFRCFACLTEAHALATALNAFPLVFEASNALAERFDVDARRLKLDAIEQAAKTAKDADRYLVILAGLDMVNELIRNDEFEYTERLKSMNLISNALWLNTAWKNRLRALELCQKECERIKAAISQLKADPTDRAANLAVGKYACYFKEDWANGLPLLRQSGEPVLADLAGKDLVDPSDIKSQVEIAEAWWKLSLTEPEQLQENIRVHARRLAHKAWPRLPASEQKELIPHVALKLGGKFLKPGLDGHYLLKQGLTETKARRVDYQLNFQKGFAPATDKVPTGGYEASWQGWLVAPRPQYYRLRARANESCRILLDGGLVMTTSGEPGLAETVLLLTGRPQHLRIDYQSKDQDGSMVLSWSLIGGFPDQPIPPEALFH